VTLPPEIRERLGLQPGSAVELRLSNGGLELIPEESEVRLVREGPFLVAVHPESVGVIPAELTDRLIAEFRGGGIDCADDEDALQ
jgi:AbrB family looped-hinge helix DNA binding protein